MRSTSRAGRRLGAWCALALSAPALPVAGAEMAPARVGVVRVAGAISPGERAALERRGVRLLEYRGDDAWLAEVRGRAVGPDAFGPLVRGVRALTPAEKRSPDLDALPRRGGGGARVSVHLRPGASPEAIEAVRRAAEQAAPGVALRREGDRAVLDAALAAGGGGDGDGDGDGGGGGVQEFVERLGGFDDVVWIEPTPEVALRDESVRWIVQGNRPHEFPLHERGLAGEGQILGLMDGEPYKDHCAFIDYLLRPPGPEHRKIVAYNAPFGADEHGTFVAGLAVGAGHRGETLGVAPAARFVFNLPPGVNDPGLLGRLALHAAQGARVHSNSWGNDSTRAYDSLAWAVDRFCWEDDANLVVFAVSNTAAVTNPENAKSALGVGACEDAPGQDRWYAGGAGPTADGRRKPEVVSPGRSITSAWGLNCFTTTMSGTSAAAPSVAGAALLARQYFTEGFHPSGAPRTEDAFEPSGQLLRAVLVNSGVPLAGEWGYPSPRQGFGRVQLDEALHFAGEARRLAVADVRNASPEAFEQAEVRAYELEVFADPAAGDLEVTLAYADAPAALGASPATVNDLDLVLQSPSGAVYFGNAFDEPRGVSLASSAGGRRDPLNTLEHAVIRSPEPGVWRVRVEGSAVRVPGQGFALVATGPVGRLEPEAVQCPGDADGDGDADVADLLVFLARFRESAPAADMDANGRVDVADLLAFLAAFRAGC